MKTNLVVCDIQPEYVSSFPFTIAQFTKWLNKSSRRRDKITYFYNGHDTLGMIRENALISWLVENGLNENVLNKINFIDKGYGFLRNAMDENVDEELIIEGIRTIIAGKQSIEVEGNPIFYNVCYPVIEKLENIVFVGGSRCACLQELDLVAQAYNRKYQFKEKFCYW
jgi:hypothetical protein